MNVSYTTIEDIEEIKTNRYYEDTREILKYSLGLQETFTFKDDKIRAIAMFFEFCPNCFKCGVILAKDLKSLSYVTDVIYPRDVADVMSSNISELSLILIVIALVLLLVSMVLIINTIRLQIYSKRFLINTMALVGATSWVTRRPFVWRNMLMGLGSSVVSLAILGAVVYYVEFRLGIMLFTLTWYNVTFISMVVIIAGLLITLLASLIATGRYIHMDNNSLYEI